MDKIQIADDSFIDRTMLKNALTKLGYAVTAHEDGISALKAIRNISEPTLFVLDWIMPGIDGVDICSDLTSNPPLHPVYIIMITSKTSKKDIALALDNGANDIIAKPFNKHELRSRINVGIRMLSFQKQLLENNRKLQEYNKKIKLLAEERAKQLVHADRMSTLGILSAGMAHEINNPVTFISVNIDTLEDNLPLLLSSINGAVSADEKKLSLLFVKSIPDILNEMKNGIGRIKNIVKGLKTYVHGKVDYNNTFSIHKSIDEALKLCHNRLKYNIKIIKNFENVPPAHGDQRQFEQVLVNLFINAADAIEESPKNNGDININTFLEHNQITLLIWDTGTGIPEKKLNTIFTPFYTTKDVGKGTGLGLSISKNIIKDLGGDIVVKNHSDGGALFKITLPNKEENQ